MFLGEREENDVFFLSGGSFFLFYLQEWQKSPTFAPANRKKSDGVIAQLVEQRTENPCVPGSIPGDTTQPLIDEVNQGFSFSAAAVGALSPPCF